MTELDPAKHGRWHQDEKGHVWFAPVQFAEATANLSGEPMAYCPRCGDRAQVSSPWVPLPEHYLHGLGWASAPWEWRRVQLKAGCWPSSALLLQSAAGEFARNRDPVIMAVREDWMRGMEDSPNGKLLAAAPLLHDAVCFLFSRANRHLVSDEDMNRISALMKGLQGFEP